MLTKDLIRARKTGVDIRPEFVRNSDPALLELATGLLGCLTPGVSMDSYEEATDPFLKAQRDAKLAKGIRKVLLDLCGFGQAVELEGLSALRAKAFEASAAAIKEGADSLSQVVSAAAAAAGLPVESFASQIYADLPGSERLEAVPNVFPKELLDRYNCALAQSLLLHSSSMEVLAEDSDPAQMRKMFKYLKFFRLLADIQPASQAEPNPSKTMDAALERKRLHSVGMSGPYRILVEGPASVLEFSKSYGLQLACFLPAVCALSKWSVTASVNLGGTERRLRLDETSGLVSHYRNFSAYVPQEIIIFHKTFREKAPEWEIVGESGFIDLGGGSLVFPDLSFRRRSDGAAAHLELFHKWHKGQLRARLEALARKPSTPLAVGVEKSAFPDAEERKLLEASPGFSGRGFFFKQFPGVEQTRECLAKVAAGRVLTQDNLL